MYGLKQKDLDALCTCFAQFAGIKQVILYGSRAKGNYRIGSDIDLTIVGDLNFTDLLRLETIIDDLLLPYKIDLSLKSHINSADLLAHIERVGQVFYSAVDSEGAMSGLS